MAIELKPWTIEDNETVVEWVKKDPSILKSLMMPGDWNEFQLRSFLLNSLQRQDSVRFMVLRDGEPVGAVSAFDIQPTGAATISLMVSPEKRNGFTAMAAAKHAIKAAFNGVGFTRLSALVSKDNVQALKLARLLGFKDLGVVLMQIEKDETDG